MQPTLSISNEQLDRIVNNIKGQRPQNKMPEMTFTQETITPQIAAQYLQRNTQNRPISQYQVKEFVKHIQNGTFKITHQGIAFDTTGALIDGQQRLTAIVIANKPVQMIVARNAHPSSFTALDSGKRRTLSDHCHLLGINNYTRVASMVTPMASWVKAQELNVYTARGITGAAGNRGATTTKEQIEFAQAYQQELEEAATIGTDYNKKSGFWTPSRVSILYAIYKQAGNGAFPVKAFFDSVFVGINISNVRQPTHLLREKLRNNVLLRSKHEGLRDEVLFGYAIEAANLFLANQTRARLSWKPGEKDFPQPPVEALQFFSRRVSWAGEDAK